MQVAADEFQTLVAPLLGLPISHPWKGYGSAIFLELGALDAGKNNPNGEACISVEWDWRIENGCTVLSGSSVRGPRISRFLLSLKGTMVSAIETFGSPSELCVLLSNGYRLRTMAALPGDPQWTIRLLDGRYLQFCNGSLLLDHGSGPATTEEECAIADHAGATAERWGATVIAAKDARCRDCSAFVWLDGESSLLEYGVCTQAGGLHDGRAVFAHSGCEKFTGNR